MWKRTLGLILAATATAAAPACSCSDDAGESGGGSRVDAAANSTGSSQGGQNGNGGGDGGEAKGPAVSVGGLGGSEQGVGGQGGACADITIEFEPIVPSVKLLIDQSGSMSENFGDDGERWDVLYETLMNPATGIVTELQSQVRFGLALYTGGNSCPGIIDVPIAIDNRDAIDLVYAQEGPENDTPTGDSITAVLPDVVSYAEEGPKFIVLATDGEPDTCEDGDDTEGGRLESIAAARAAFAQGIKVFVISVGNDVAGDHLQDVANAGAGLPLPENDGDELAPYWQALDAAELVMAFDTIINGVRSCVLTVDGEINPDKACDGSVRIDGEEIACDDPNGWVLNSPTEIELQGDACDLIQGGEHVVDATFPCDAAESSGSTIPD